jgi:chitinase
MSISRWLAAMTMLTGMIGHAAPAKQPEGSQVIAYVFVKDGLLRPEEIDATKVTCINYAFADIRNGAIAQGFAHDRENFAVLNGLKQRNPQLKVLISVGGWTWSGGFSEMSRTRESRRKFIDSAVRFVEANQLDGVDIDWEYPGLPGIGNPNRPEDKQNYTALMKELRQALDRYGKKAGRHMTTSVATGAAPSFVEHTELKKVQRYVDTINLMSYDYYEQTSDRVTGHHAPLFTNPADPKLISADASVRNYEKAGVPARKIVLGVPFYGHVWANVGETNHGLFQPGETSRIPANYRDIVQTHLKSGFERYWDGAASAPYLYNAATKTFITYEDPESMRLKCRYVRKNKLGGVMFWEYHGDADGALLGTINQALHETGEADAK